MMKIIMISLTLTAKGLKWVEREWMCKETKNGNMYHLIEMLNAPEDHKKKKFVKKESLLKIDTNIAQKPGMVSYFLWCPDDKREQGRQLLLVEVKKTVTDMKTHIDNLWAYIDPEKK